LALGHVHKRLDDDPIFNPGSLETNSMEEMEWAHGFFDVQVDTGGSPRHTWAYVSTPHLRPFRRLSVSAEGCASLEEFVGSVEERIASERGVPERAVIELQLGGVAEFRRQDVPIERLKGAAALRFNPLVVRVRNNLVPPGIVRERGGERMSRAELERRVVEHLVYQNAEYRDRADLWARLVLDVKNMAAEKDLPANIADQVRTVLKGMQAEAELPSLDALNGVPAEVGETVGGEA
jgi:hypothetical protein